MDSCRYPNRATFCSDREVRTWNLVMLCLVACQKMKLLLHFVPILLNFVCACSMHRYFCRISWAFVVDVALYVPCFFLFRFVVYNYISSSDRVKFLFAAYCIRCNMIGLKH